MGALVSIREANAGDVEGIYQLLALYADMGKVLRRERENIRQHLGNFVVAESDGMVRGCGAVRDFGNDLLELRSLAVSPELRGGGIGRAIVEAIVAGLQLKRQNWQLFTLTCAPDFFRRLGFRDTEREKFPDKIWSDCVQCPRNQCCDEIALVIDSEMMAQTQQEF